MGQLQALAFLEWRQIVHRARAIAASPGRLVFYALVAAYFGGLTWLRTRAPHVPATPSLAEPFASAAFFALIALCGIIAYGGASGFVGVFASAADARFLNGAPLDQRLVVLWLQLRRSATVLLRLLISLLLYGVLAARASGPIGMLFASLSVAVIMSALSVPMLKLRTETNASSAKALAAAVAVIGIFPMAIVLSSLTHANDAASGVMHLGAGRFVNSLLAGDVRAHSVLWLIAAGTVALSWLCGGDLYPELYQSSQSAHAARLRVREGGSLIFTSRRRYDATRLDASHARLFAWMRGSWAIVWKEWLGFVRSPGSRRLFWLGTSISIAAGFGIGWYARQSRDALMESLVFLPTIFFMFAIFMAMGAAVTLKIDIGKPLWWMGNDSLGRRLLAWVAATSWRSALIASLGVAAWSVTIHMPDLIVAGVLCAVAVVAYMRASGLAIYAMFPSTLDQRGPLGAMRALVTYLLCAPPLVVGGICFAIAHSTVLAALGGLVTSGLEIYALLQFAAWRITGRGAAFATAEAT